MNTVAGSWFKIEGHVRARDDEDARDISKLIFRAAADRSVRNLVVFFDAPEDESDEGDDIELEL